MDNKTVRKLRQVILFALLLAMTMQTMAVASADSMEMAEAIVSDAVLQRYLVSEVDQRSAVAKECVNITSRAAQPFSLAGRVTPAEVDTATVLLKAETTETGKVREQYVTLAQARSSYDTNSEEAGDLTAAVRIYWDIEYDELFGGNNIAFDRSCHFYYDSGASGVSRIYGENYVALGNNWDMQTNTWTNPSSGSMKTLYNDRSGEFSWDDPDSDNCTAHATTTVYATSVGSLSVDIEMSW